ncbi:MAG TPA: hypothetical protein VN512_05465 [Clostridia bacterium]|nr:hypothetical protein [Clostridia bacterium]
MEKLYGVLETVLPIVVMLGLGILFKKLRAFTAEGIDNIKKLVLNICLPAILFRTFASVTYTWSVAGVSTTYFLLSCLAIALAFGLKKIFTPKTFLMPFLLTSYESGMIGFALYTQIFGLGNLGNIAILDLGHAPFMFIVFKTLIDNSRRHTLKTVLKDMLSSPLIWCIFLGILTGVTGLGKLIVASPLGGAFDEVLLFLSAPTAALIMFVVGYSFDISHLDLKRAFALAGGRLVFQSLVAAAGIFITGLFVPNNDLLKWAFVTMAILPPSFLVSIFMKDEKETAFCSDFLSFYTLITMLLFAVMAVINA